MSIQIRVVGLVMSAIVASAATAQTAVEWKASEGGNGHWYALKRHVGPIDFFALEAFVQTQLGAHLATIPSQTEDSFVWIALGRPAYAVLGAYQDLAASDYAEPNRGWRWVTAEPFADPRWTFGEPSNGEGREHILAYNFEQSWNDWQTDNIPQGSEWSYVIEWETDCNHDGIVDYGQIQSGLLADDNANGVPDSCETLAHGVNPSSGTTAGGTAITVYGTNFPESPTVLVGGNPATNVVRHSTQRLSAITPPGPPGTASVQVGDSLQPDAFYYVSECHADLDQNGLVDGGDLALLLLEYGPCTSSAYTAKSQPAPELLTDEPAQKPTHR